VRGPCCLWKVVDWAISWDIAAAAAFSYGLPTRCHASFGQGAGALGHLPDSDNVGAITIGPVSPEKGRTWEYWYSRDTAKEIKATQEEFFENYVSSLPSFWVSGAALGVKAYAMHSSEYQMDPRHFVISKDEALQEKYAEIGEKIMGIIKRYTGKKVEMEML
ncbi:MAG: hypothetical protein JRJ86_23840, partial [Deltaproteobacteria bacterium]|nr:hypothetical protein [Deltaproteobacteria bacterium]